MVDFIRRQVTAVSNGGASALFRKLGLVALVPPALVVVVVVRLLRPFIKIRFGPLASFRIGHYSSNTETYLTERDAGLHGRRTLDIFYDLHPVCNEQLGRMWRRVIPISPLAVLPDRLNRAIPGGNAHAIPFRFYQGRDVHGILADSEPHLSFTAAEEAKGQAALQGLGIEDGAEFVCILGRDPSYLASSDPKRNWDYHDFRDMDIQSYLPAAEELTNRGYYVFRMGSVVKDALQTSNPRIIDYATGSPTAFMDIYLTAKCKFFISCGSGPDGVANALRKPVAFVSYVPIEWDYTWAPTHIMIPKRLWLRSENRCLSFREILQSDIGHFRETAQYDDMGLDLQENTPEEIRAVAVEMDERINGTWQDDAEGVELQRKYRSLFLPSDRHGVNVSKIGAEFIRQNQHLLD